MKYQHRFPGKRDASINLFTLLCVKYVETVPVKKNRKAESLSHLWPRH